MKSELQTESRPYVPSPFDPQRWRQGSSGPV